MHTLTAIYIIELARYFHRLFYKSIYTYWIVYQQACSSLFKSSYNVQEVLAGLAP